jgi:hypothetical protein
VLCSHCLWVRRSDSFQQGIKRFKRDEEKLADFIKRHVSQLLKADKLTVLVKLERQEEVDLAVKVRAFAILPHPLLSLV